MITPVPLIIMLLLKVYLCTIFCNSIELDIVSNFPPFLMPFLSDSCASLAACKTNCLPNFSDSEIACFVDSNSSTEGTFL